MKTMTKLMAGAAVALAMSTGAAQAAVFIGIDTGSGITQVFTQADGAFSYSGPAGGFETLLVNGDTAELPGLLHSQNVEVNNTGTGAASVKVYVTHTDIEGGLPEWGYLSSFTGNSNRAGFTVKLSTLASASNAIFGGTLLNSVTYTGQGATSNNDVFAAALPASQGLYSVTHVYEIADEGGARGSTSPSITLQAAVPEPATWGLMIMGFGGAGAMLRSRRRALAAAA